MKILRYYLDKYIYIYIYIYLCVCVCFGEYKIILSMSERVNFFF